MEFITKAEYNALSTVKISDVGIVGLGMRDPSELTTLKTADPSDDDPSTTTVDESDYFSRLDIWVDMANGLLSRFVYDESAPGFRSAMKVAAVAVVEQFYVQAQAEIVVAANRPFQSEKMGSFSYSRGSAATMQAEIQRESEQGLLS